MYCDAHNHLQDTRLDASREPVFAELRRMGVRAVVNGTREEDWTVVLNLARENDWIIPSLGLHPWYLRQRSSAWRQTLEHLLRGGTCAVGEIGLDHWIQDYDARDQETVFIEQLNLAAAMNLPVSIHCLKAWGRLVDILQEQKRPARGFLLHSYGGSLETARRLVELGGYFSLSGYFAHARKARQQQVFREIPRDRLLLETDAPDMLPPPEYLEKPLTDDGIAINSPCNIAGVYEFAADLLGVAPEELHATIEGNFQRLFGFSMASADTTREAATNPNAPVTNTAEP